LFIFPNYCVLSYSIKKKINGILETINKTFIDLWNRLTFDLLTQGMWYSLVGLGEYHISRVAKSKGQPHQKSIIVYYYSLTYPSNSNGVMRFIRSDADLRFIYFLFSSRFDHKIIRTGCVKPSILSKNDLFWWIFLYSGESLYIICRHYHDIGYDSACARF
jgi:hypothetical protein